MRRFIATLLLGAALLGAERSHACGGCFGPPASLTTVTGHRMAFAVSDERTVLWDQFEYSGSPEDFSWVLPVLPGAYLEASTDAWFEALETVTQTRVLAPPHRQLHPHLHQAVPPAYSSPPCSRSSMASAPSRHSGLRPHRAHVSLSSRGETAAAPATWPACCAWRASLPTASRSFLPRSRTESLGPVRRSAGPRASARRPRGNEEGGLSPS